MADVNPFGDTAEEEDENLNPFGDTPETPRATSGELDLNNLRKRRESDFGETDAEIIQAIKKEAGPNLRMDGKPFSLDSLLDQNQSPSAILDFITSGNVVDTNIDSQGDAMLAAAGKSSTVNPVSLPIDLVNAGLQGVESLGRRAVNTVAGTDFSTDPEDFTFSSTTPFLGSQSQQDLTEAAFGKDLYRDKEEIPTEFRPTYEATRIVTENATAIIPALKAAKVGMGVSNSNTATTIFSNLRDKLFNNPLIDGIRSNTKTVAKTEGAATTGAATLVAGAEATGINDNPWASMGLEFLGSILGGSASSISRGTKDAATSVGGGIVNSFASIFSDDSASKAAINKFLIAADSERQNILKQIEGARIAGNEARIAELEALAEMFTPERMLADLKTSLQPQAGDTTGAASRLPIGELTGNPAFIAIQNSLLDTSNTLRGNVAKQVNSALTNLLNASEMLARAGNTEAADLVRTSYFQEALNTRIAVAKADAEAQINALGPNRTQQEASVIAQTTLFQAKEQIRAMETFLYERIDPNLTTAGNILANRISSLRSNNILAGETLAGGGQMDAVIANIFREAGGDGPMSAKNVRLFRSRMLSEARSAAANNDFHQAGIFDELANAAVEELNSIPDSVGGKPIRDARNFSAELNKRFTRYFNLSALKQASKGGTEIRPEQTLEAAMSGTATDASESMGELRAGAELADKAAPIIDSMFDEELRKYAARNPEVGELPFNPVAMRTAMPSTDLSTDLRFRMDPKDKPSDNMERSRRIADSYFDFAKEMDAQGKPEMAAEARKRAKAYQGYRGPSGEEYFDPEVTPETPQQPIFEQVDGETSRIDGTDRPSSVPSILDDAVAINLGPIMTKAQEDFLRGAALKLKDTNNTISVEKLEQFMSATGNAEVLKAFPNFRAELASLIDAQNTVDEIVGRFEKIGSSEKLPKAIGEVLAGENPVEDFTRLSQEAIDPASMQDFRLSVMDTLFSKARLEDGTPNFFKMADELTKPLSGKKGDTSILELMEQTGVISADDKAAIRDGMVLGVEIQKRNSDFSKLENVLPDMGDFVNNVSRIFGANFGARFGVGEGSQLQAAAIGSAAFKKITSGLPVANQQRQAELMVLQPDLALAFLSKNPEIRRSAFHAFKEWAIGYGSTYKGLTKTQAVGKLAKDATIEASTKTARGVLDAGSQSPLSSAGALSGNTDDQRDPTVTIDEQMMDLGIE